MVYAMEGDLVGGQSIKYLFSKDSNWTKALKYMLANLKWALAWMVARQSGQILVQSASNMRSWLWFKQPCSLYTILPLCHVHLSVGMLNWTRSSQTYSIVVQAGHKVADFAAEKVRILQKLFIWLIAVHELEASLVGLASVDDSWQMMRDDVIRLCTKKHTSWPGFINQFMNSRCCNPEVQNLFCSRSKIYHTNQDTKFGSNKLTDWNPLFSASY